MSSSGRVGMWASLRAALSSRRIGAVTLQSFSSGLPLGLVWIALPAFLTYRGVDIKTVGLFSLAQAPWTFKFLWSPLMDRFGPRFGSFGRAAVLDSRLPAPAHGLGPRPGRLLHHRRRHGHRAAGPADRLRLGLAGHRHRRVRGRSAGALGAGARRRRPNRARPDRRARLGRNHHHARAASRLASGASPASRCSSCRWRPSSLVARADGAAAAAPHAPGGGLRAAARSLPARGDPADSRVPVLLQVRREPRDRARAAVPHPEVLRARGRRSRDGHDRPDVPDHGDAVRRRRDRALRPDALPLDLRSDAGRRVPGAGPRRPPDARLALRGRDRRGGGAADVAPADHVRRDRRSRTSARAWRPGPSACSCSA